MIISVRTLVNTTLFRSFILLAFWAYTRWIDDTPAKTFLYNIGWTELSSLTVVNTESISLSGDVFNDRLDKIETLIQATNMNCSLDLLEAGKNTNNSNTSTSTALSFPSLSSLPSLQIPVFDMVADNKLPAAQRANINSFAMITRPITSAKLQTPNDVVNFLKNITLTSDELKKGYINIFDGQKLTVANQQLANNTLTLGFEGIDSLSSTQRILLTQALTKTFSQLPEIQTVIIQ